MKVELRNNSPQLYFFIFQKRNFYIAEIGIVSLLVSCGLIYLGTDVEKHPMRDSVLGLIATFLIMGGGIIGWIAMLVMAFCIYSAVVCERKHHEVVRLRTMLEKS